MFTAIHHIAIICSDEAKTLEFYVNKLGFEVSMEVCRPDRQDTLRMLRRGDVVLELFPKPDAPQRVTEPEALGLRHLAFRVENIEEAVRWLSSMDIETEPVRMDPFSGGRFTFFRDPDGLPLEIHE